MQVVLLDLQVAGLVWTGEQGGQSALQGRLAAVGANHEAPQLQPAGNLRKAVHDTRPGLFSFGQGLGVSVARARGLALAQRNGRRGQMFARAHPTRTVAIPLVFARIQHHGGRHGPARTADAQNNLFVVAGFDGHGPGAYEVHAAGPETALAGTAQRRQQLGERLRHSRDGRLRTLRGEGRAQREIGAGRHHMLAMMRVPNSEHETSFAPSVRRAKS